VIIGTVLLSNNGKCCRNDQGGTKEGREDRWERGWGGRMKGGKNGEVRWEGSGGKGKRGEGEGRE
jgi:hypothetical protein